MANPLTDHINTLKCVENGQHLHRNKISPKGEIRQKISVCKKPVFLSTD
ncbi:hypothetical protein HMPREF9098_0661 [Kingella denitrificans ATCC 33394]|uniref:Uncharacterized protein n=1 Tax=Kingella denitrificans ATCC 33394 TaxID=888741 RepID=F0EXV1_9NEIS|nr:hypothetical protein HMPREF9098_0661 [Kingella denitrificans ATCC 33394]